MSSPSKTFLCRLMNTDMKPRHILRHMADPQSKAHVLKYCINCFNQKSIPNQPIIQPTNQSTHLYVICLCCHFCPVRAYRFFRTLNLDAPPSWSGTPHRGFFIQLGRTENTISQNRVYAWPWLNKLCNAVLSLLPIDILVITKSHTHKHARGHTHTSAKKQT